MITNQLIQASWITKLKSISAITSLVPYTFGVEIREDSWQGTDFVYPNIRVRLGDLTPQTPTPTCSIYLSPVSILVFSEEKSSKQADDIAGVVFNQLVGTGFTGLVKVSGITLDHLTPAIVPEGANIWMASVNFNAMIQNA